MTQLTNVETLVDTFGLLKAEMAELTQRADAIKEQLSSMGVGAYEGGLYRVTVSASTRETLDMKAVREKLSDQFIRAHTKVTEVVTVSCKARTGTKVAA